MKITFCFLIILFTNSLALGARDLGAHVHGVLSLDIAVDKKQLLIMVKAPSESFLGFEYKAKTDKEKKIVKEAKTQWESHIFHYLGAEQLKDCKITSKSWTQEFSGESHSSIIGESYIECDKELKKRILEISFKKKYSYIQAIHLQLIREDGSVVNKKYRESSFNIKL